MNDTNQDADGGEADSGSPTADSPYHGFLQLRVDHNLEDASCIDEGNCQITANQEEGTDQFLQRVRDDSTLAVLHWNRAIPYQTFAQEPPSSEETVEFYDNRIDPKLLEWLNSYRDQFQRLPHGFLQVSALDGGRFRPAKWHVRDGKNRHIAEQTCPEIAPGSTFEVTGPDGETQTIDYQRSYVNFLVYLYRKLQPDDFALVVEGNLFYENCPDRWDGFVDLYHEVYDAVRDEVGSDPRLFASFTYSDLLDYDLNRCTGGAQTTSCDTDIGSSPYDSLDPSDCYNVDASPVEDFAAGDHLDMLGLSMYPDGLLMRVPDGPKAVEIHPTDSSGPGDCQQKIVMPSVVDPWEQLDRLGWDGPVAITETSSRSCPVWNWFENENGDKGLLRIPNSSTTQKYWLDRALETARERDMAFVVQSLYEDFPPIGRPFLQAVDNPTPYNAINLWACSGFYTADGSAKTDLLERWPAATP